MPFPEQTPRPFLRDAIERIPPNTKGCYGLFVDRGPWVYVGKGDIRERLLAHLNGDNPCIASSKPTHYVDEVTASMDVREKQLIMELRPKCNQKVG